MAETNRMELAFSSDNIVTGHHPTSPDTSKVQVLVQLLMYNAWLSGLHVKTHSQAQHVYLIPCTTRQRLIVTNTGGGGGMGAGGNVAEILTVFQND